MKTVKHGTTGSERYDLQINQIRQTERVVACKRNKYKRGYIKHKGKLWERVQADRKPI